MDHLTILNQNAGNFNWPEAFLIQEILRGSKGSVHTTKNFFELEQILRLHEDDQPEMVGIGGGDGTVSRTLTKISESWGDIPDRIATYSMGTMNNISIFSEVHSFWDKVRRKLRLRTSPIKLAERISESIKSEEPLNTKDIALLDTNGRKGFNIGFGIIPKLVWLYYGNSIEYYQKFDQNLQENNVIEYSTQKGGTYQALSTMAKSIAGVMKKNSLENKFFTERLEADIYVDGHKLNLPQQPTGMYLASYEELSLGLPFFIPRITPEARAIPSKMQVVISWAEPKDYVKAIPTVFSGNHMQKAIYVHAQELEIISDKVIPCQVDADYVFNNNFKINYDRDLKVISPK